jgi:AcrR family transcriptional regulator
LSTVKDAPRVSAVSLTTAADPAGSTRSRILDVALELFAAQGFAATTTRELAERLGFTKAALYYHFPTKDALLQALVQPVVDQLSALVEGPGGVPEDGDADGARRRLLTAYLGIIAEHRQLLGVLVQDPSATGRPAMEAGKAFYERLTARLGGPGPVPLAQRTRIRFVLGGLHAAVLFAEPDDDPVTVRTTALDAALAALGLSAVG